MELTDLFANSRKLTDSLTEYERDVLNFMCKSELNIDEYKVKDYIASSLGTGTTKIVNDLLKKGLLSATSTKRNPASKVLKITRLGISFLND